MRGFPEFYHFSSSTTSTVTYAAFHDEENQTPAAVIKRIPIHSTGTPSDYDGGTILITVHLPKPPLTDTRSAAAAAKIQAAYRAGAIRALYRTISTVDAQAGEIQRQETNNENDVSIKIQWKMAFR
ncbi:unnamed protein product [Linum trigynum]|uniref:Uncharacterized protein n=1 Tax=Linum trigynum TaxID=586398 RepID=A0AAV2C6G9_9ROSI